MKYVIYACIILHNMMVEARRHEVNDEEHLRMGEQEDLELKSHR